MMKSLFRMDPVSREKRSELINEFFESRIKNKIDDVDKISVTHLIYSFETFLCEKFDLPMNVASFEFLSEISPLMNELGYEYQGHRLKIRFNDATKDKLDYDKVVKALKIDHLTIVVDAHRYFQLKR